MGLITNSLVFAAGAYVGWKAKQIYDEKKHLELLEGPFAGEYITDEEAIIDVIARTNGNDYPEGGLNYWPRPDTHIKTIVAQPPGIDARGRAVTPVRTLKMGMGRRALYPDQSRKYFAGPLTIDSQRRMPTRRTK